MDGAAGAERVALGGCLDEARAAVVATIDGVPGVLLREPLVSDGWSLLAIVKHLTRLERWWFGSTFAGVDGVRPSIPEDPADDWMIERTDTPRRILRSYEEACRQSRLVVARADIDQRARPPSGGPVVALRWVLLHMIAETFRHGGHADALRQLIDGQPAPPPCSAPSRPATWQRRSSTLRER